MFEDLENHILFRRLGKDVFKKFGPHLTLRELRGGEILFEEGDASTSIFLVISGRLRAQVKRNEALVVIGEIGHDEIVGEMAILTGEPRSASILAIRDSELWELSKHVFDDLVREHPQTMMSVTRLIVSRFAATIRSNHQETRPTTIALLPLTADTPLAECSKNLLRALGGSEKVLYLNSAFMKARKKELFSEKDRDNQNQQKLKKWLNEKENEFEYILYEADQEFTPWSKRCLHQADRILLVGRAESLLRAQRAFEALNAGQQSATFAKKELVLLYPNENVKPAETHQWLEHCHVSGHHHVRMTRFDDFKRLARILTNQALSVALGGGGARGFAHIGVLQAFEELGIPIDLIGGTSMGSLIGAQYAMGCDAQTIREQTHCEFFEHGRLWDFTFPAIAMTRGRSFRRIGINLFGDTRIEDLWLDFFCVTTNLTRAEPVVHRSGLLREWIRASTAIPGLIPPRFHSSGAFVDGGLINNLPVDVLVDQGRGLVIGVDVSSPWDKTVSMPDMKNFSPWRVLFNKLNPFAENIQVPSLFNILIRTATISGNRSLQAFENEVDLVLRPPTCGISLLELKSFDEVVKIGYDYAIQELERWYTQKRKGSDANAL